MQPFFYFRIVHTAQTHCRWWRLFAVSSFLWSCRATKLSMPFLAARWATTATYTSPSLSLSRREDAALKYEGYSSAHQRLLVFYFLCAACYCFFLGRLSALVALLSALCVLMENLPEPPTHAQLHLWVLTRFVRHWGGRTEDAAYKICTFVASNAHSNETCWVAASFTRRADLPCCEACGLLLAPLLLLPLLLPLLPLLLSQLRPSAYDAS